MYFLDSINRAYSASRRSTLPCPTSLNSSTDPQASCLLTHFTHSKLPTTRQVVRGRLSFRELTFPPLPFILAEPEHTIYAVVHRRPIDICEVPNADVLSPSRTHGELAGRRDRRGLQWFRGALGRQGMTYGLGRDASREVECCEPSPPDWGGGGSSEGRPRDASEETGSVGRCRGMTA
jgi:hypothetical protein